MLGYCVGRWQTDHPLIMRMLQADSLCSPPCTASYPHFVVEALHHCIPYDVGCLLTIHRLPACLPARLTPPPPPPRHPPFLSWFVQTYTDNKQMMRALRDMKQQLHCAQIDLERSRVPSIQKEAEEVCTVRSTRCATVVGAVKPGSSAPY